jgi:YesN/AraC family two-component response regulator
LDQKKYKAIMIRYSKDFIQNHADTADNATFFYSYYYKTRALKLSQLQSDQVQDLCLELFTEFNSHDRDYEYVCYALLIQLLIRVKRIGLLGHEDSRVDYPNYLHMKVSKVAGYINGHFKEPIVLREVAEKFHISEYYLSRNFRVVTGFSFNEYVNTTRVNMAKKLLKETNYNITRIAEEVGFNTITHFGRTFRKVVGISPKAYRIQS